MGSELVVKDKSGLQALVQGLGQSIADVLPKHVTPERVMKMAMVAASRSPKLYQCTKVSLAKAIMTAAELGLDCSGTLGSAYIIPYGAEAQIIIGYRGLIDLARRSGKIKSIQAHIVYRNDEYRVNLGTDGTILHVPKLDGERGDMVFVYAVAELIDCSKQSEIMTRDQVEAIRKRSRAASSGPWVTDYDEMARKTVVRRLCKYLPLSAEMEIALEAEQESIIDADLVSPEPPKPGRNKIGFRRSLGNAADNAPPELTSDEPDLPAEPEEREPGQEG
jgi:recombination protein RecT